MKDAGYYGIGTDEYNRFRTTDNGRTWYTNGVAVGEGKQVYDRIIFGSTNNGGLTYSDDGGNTIMKSDHETGNWGNIVYVRNNNEEEQQNQYTVYASSLDDETLVYSVDLGEHWVEIPGAVAGSEAQVINGIVYIYGEGTVTRIENNIPVVVAQNATLVNGEVKAEPIEPDKIDGVLSVVLNKLFLPLFSKRFAGMSFNKLCSLTPDMTLSNIDYKRIIYNEAGEAALDGIDYEYYCNMRPMTYSLSDIISTSIGENAQLVLFANIDDELINNKVLKEMFDYIDQMITSYREIAKVVMVKRIMGVEADISSLQDIDQNSEDYVNAVKYANMMINVQKGAVASIMGTILNKTFALDNARRLSILKAALYECITEQAGSIAYQLNEIQKRINMDYFYVNEQDFTVDFKFGNALETAITKYIDAIFKIVKFDNPEDNSKQYEIYTAAEAYKDNRSTLLDYIIKEADSNLKSKEIKYDKLNTYLEDIEEFKNKIDTIYNNYISARDTIVAKTQLGEDIEEYKDNYPYIYNVCKAATASEDKTAMLENYYHDNILDDSDKSSLRQKFMECYNNYDFKYKQETIISDISKEIKEEVILPTLQSAIDSMEGASAVKEYIYLAEEDFISSEEYSVKNIIDYYNKILAKFKLRCVELLDYVVDNFGKNTSSNTVDDYYNMEAVARQDNKILEWLAADYDKDFDLDALTPYIENRGEVIKNILWNSYKESKEVI